jgi:polysaccharide export outer membrane protein
MRPPRAWLGACALGALLAPGCRYFRPPPLARGTLESRVAEAAAPRLVLAPGDRVDVQVLGHPESSTPPNGLVLGPDGAIDLAPLGPLVLAGLAPEEARARLAEAFARYLREPKVAFNVLELAGRRFYVFGEMERPGSFALERGLTALQALTRAGGFRPGADRKHVALLRGTRDGLEVHFFDGATPGTDGMVPIQADDFLFVRLSGAGTFRDQILPIVQSVVPPITGLASLVVVADRLNE